MHPRNRQIVLQSTLRARYLADRRREGWKLFFGLVFVVAMFILAGTIDCWQ